MLTKIFKNILTIAFALTFLACSFFTRQFAATPSPVDIEKEEAAVYSYFVREKDRAVIIKDASTDILGNDPRQMVDSIKSNFKELSTETADSYVERNKEPGQLSPDMDLGVDYVLLSREEAFQGSEEYFMFSRVGFNQALDQALVYVGDVAGPLAGSGSYFLMQKKDGQWTVKQSIMVWIS